MSKLSPAEWNQIHNPQNDCEGDISNSYISTNLTQMGILWDWLKSTRGEYMIGTLVGQCTIRYKSCIATKKQWLEIYNEAGWVKICIPSPDLK